MSNARNRKVVGIVGGMGPEATADLFLKIVKATPAATDQEHLRVVIDCNPQIPDRSKYVLEGGPDPVPEIIRTAQNVEKMGADVLVIPCNTAHYFHGSIQAKVGPPVLHMMNEVAAHLSGKVKKVGLLASTVTVSTGLYHTALAKVGIETLVPEPEGQRDTMAAIYAVKAGDLAKGRELALREGENLAAAGAEAIIAGCTEIPLVLHEGDLSVPVVDATDVIAKRCVEICHRTT